MRRALVLSGGGSRGAYEIGAWQAFSELGVRFQAVYGTSAGAINAALFAQGDLEKASSLWENINIKQLMNAENEDFTIDSMISRKRDVIPFLIENAKHLQVDTAPMEAFLNAHLDEGAVRASGHRSGRNDRARSAAIARADAPARYGAGHAFQLGDRVGFLFSGVSDAQD